MRIRKMIIVSAAVTILSYKSFGAVQAAEVVTYTYDARGRVIKVVRSGTVNNQTTTLTHDRVSNRKSVRR